MIFESRYKTGNKSVMGGSIWVLVKMADFDFWTETELLAISKPVELGKSYIDNSLESPK